jgi:predicted nucleic acid-binding protein
LTHARHITLKQLESSSTLSDAYFHLSCWPNWTISSPHKRDNYEELKLLEDVARGVYQVDSFGASDVAAAIAIIERHRHPRLVLADASIVVLAERLRCWDLLTLDQRRFRTVSGPNGRHFRLLPLNAAS